MYRLFWDVSAAGRAPLQIHVLENCWRVSLQLTTSHTFRRDSNEVKCCPIMQRLKTIHLEWSVSCQFSLSASFHNGALQFSPKIEQNDDDKKKLKEERSSRGCKWRKWSQAGMEGPDQWPDVDGAGMWMNPGRRQWRRGAHICEVETSERGIWASLGITWKRRGEKKQTLKAAVITLVFCFESKQSL